MTSPTTSTSLTSQLAQSVECVTHGFSLAWQKGMRPYIAVPILVNVVLFSLMTYVILGQIGSWLEGLSIAFTAPTWLSFLQPVIDFVLGATETLLWILTIVTLLLFTGSTFTAITHFIASPFNGILAEKAEANFRTLNYPNHTLSQLIGRTLLRELVKLRYWLVRLVGVFFLTLIISLIPLINLVSPAIWFAFGGWMIAIQYIDFAADNNGLSFSDTLKRLKQHQFMVLGFGIIIMGLTLIPLVNLVIVPAAICGATIAWVNILDLRASDTTAITPKP